MNINFAPLCTCKNNEWIHHHSTNASHLRDVTDTWKWLTGDCYLPEASFGLRLLSLPASVCLCVCVCGNHELVHMITHHPSKLGSPNVEQRCKTTWLRSLLIYGITDLDLHGQIELQSQNLPHFGLVHAITHHQLKLQCLNLEQKCISALFRSLPILGLIEIDLQFNFNFKPRPDWAFYVHHWHSLVRPASLKVGRIERIRREWTNSKNSHWNSSMA